MSTVWSTAAFLSRHTDIRSTSSGICMCLGYTESRCGGEGGQTKKPHPFVILSSQQRQKLQKTRLLKELRADTAAACFPWHVFLGNGRGQRRWRSVWPTAQLLLALRCALSRRREAGAAQELQDETMTNVPQHPGPRCPDTHLKVKLCYRQSGHQLAPARKGKTWLWYLLSSSLPSQCSFLTHFSLSDISLIELAQPRIREVAGEGNKDGEHTNTEAEEEGTGKLGAGQGAQGWNMEVSRGEEFLVLQ